jgi:hypothetical protein
MMLGCAFGDKRNLFEGKEVFRGDDSGHAGLMLNL